MMRLKLLMRPAALLLMSLQAMGQQGDSVSTSSAAGKISGFDYKKPLFELKDEQLENKQRLVRFSALTGYREGVKSVNLTVYEDTAHSTVRFYMMNLSVQDMLSYGLTKKERVVLEVKDPSVYRYDPSYGPETEWNRKHAYCFEYLLPFVPEDYVEVVKTEVAHYLGLTFGYEHRPEDVFVLVRTSERDKMKSKKVGSGHYDGKGKLNNMPLTALTTLMEEVLHLPVIDQTGYTDQVDLDFGGAKDIHSIRKALKKYGLDLLNEKRDMKTFVIREIKTMP